ncbi:uncharacterized protein [Amphiura filiformis]|uniref:uncharacterized protein isoform X2 n=1 Tax=Amphiura filiformis TaxID=82378 RepID=UPI003B212A60
MDSSALTGDQMALLAIGAIGTHWIFNKCLEDFLISHRYFRCRRWFQKARLLPYKKPSIVVSDTKAVHTSYGVVSVTPEIENFPDDSLAKVFYLIGDNQQRLGPYCVLSSPHELQIANTQESMRVVAIAEDPYGYRARCVFVIYEAPTIRNVTNHTRTSLSTATVRMVECTGFQSRSVQVSYYDRNKFLDTFPLASEHKLDSLQETTKKIKARATDEFGNTAETTFDIEQKIPSLSYERVSRKPTLISIAGVTLNNFPDQESAVVSYDWHQEHQVLNSSTEHELPEFSQNKGGRIVATATDCRNEYMAECHIEIGPTPSIEPITEHRRTSVDTATVHQVQCTHFAPNSTVRISYYDGETSLGEFRVGEVHDLRNLNEASKRIKARATDGFGNSAETYFTLKLPTSDVSTETGSLVVPIIMITEHTRTSVSTATIHQVQCTNFAANSTVCISYYDGETPLGESKVGEVHDLKNLKKTTRTIKAQASDEFGNSAETYFTLKLPTSDVSTETGKDDVDAKTQPKSEEELIQTTPTIREITNHTRTSLSTATVRMVECTEFQSSSVHVSYYDGNKCLGMFPLAGEHKLENLQKTTKKIKARATDEFRNTAETTFDIEQNIPSLSYEGVSRKPTSINVIGVKLDNFPHKEGTVVSYVWHQEHQVMKSSTKHELLEFSKNGGEGRIIATATDCGNEYKAECEIKVGPRPLIEPITNRTRTSVATATVRHVECKNFPADSQVYVTYYDGEECLGEFNVGDEHKLTNLKASSKEIKAQATDDLGNMAEATFVINQNIPTISYEHATRTPKSIFIKGVKLINFPSENDATLTYSCDGHDEISFTLNQIQQDYDLASGIEHELPGYDEGFNEGIIELSAVDASNEYRSQCQISIQEQGPLIATITNNTRTSVGTATVRQVECKNFPAGSQVYVTYYDGEECLGKFPIGCEHKLTNLKASSKELKAQATDDDGNLAEAIFIINQNIPSITYKRISRSPKSIFIKGVKLVNFPSKDDVTLTYSCDGHEVISHTWDQGQQDKDVASGIEYEIPGYDECFNKGKIKATAVDASNEYRAQCQISIQEQDMDDIVGILIHAQTSESTSKHENDKDISNNDQKQSNEMGKFPEKKSNPNMDDVNAIPIHGQTIGSIPKVGNDKNISNGNQGRATK